MVPLRLHALDILAEVAAFHLRHSDPVLAVALVVDTGLVPFLEPRMETCSVKQGWDHNQPVVADHS